MISWQYTVSSSHTAHVCMFQFKVSREKNIHSGTPALRAWRKIRSHKDLGGFDLCVRCLVFPSEKWGLITPPHNDAFTCCKLCRLAANYQCLMLFPGYYTDIWISLQWRGKNIHSVLQHKLNTILIICPTLIWKLLTFTVECVKHLCKHLIKTKLTPLNCLNSSPSSPLPPPPPALWSIQPHWSRARPDNKKILLAEIGWRRMKALLLQLVAAGMNRMTSHMRLANWGCPQRNLVIYTTLKLLFHFMLNLQDPVWQFTN